MAIFSLKKFNLKYVLCRIKVVKTFMRQMIFRDITTFTPVTDIKLSLMYFKKVAANI